VESPYYLQEQLAPVQVSIRAKTFSNHLLYTTAELLLVFPTVHDLVEFYKHKERYLN
jgi:hypothetical protein